MIVLLGCTMNKKNKECKAEELYSASIIFRYALAYARHINPDHIYILSAKHHVVELDDVLKPYSQMIGDMTADEHRAWADEVIKQFKTKHIDPDQKVIVLCWPDYVEYLDEYFTNMEQPLDGKQVGERLHWFIKNTPELQKNESLVSLKDYIAESIL